MSDNEADWSGFGYRTERWALLMRPVAIQVSEGFDSDTLEPTVLIALRMQLEDEDHERAAVVLSPDQADSLADELHRWASRAREKGLGA